MMTNKEKHMKLLEMAIDRGLNYSYYSELGSSTICDPKSDYIEVCAFYEKWPAGSSGGFDTAVKKIEEYKS